MTDGIKCCCSAGDAQHDVTPPDAATKWRRPEALHCAIRRTSIASTHSQSNARILDGFSTIMSHTSDFWLDYRGRLRCTYQTSAESVKIASKTDELWGARHAAMIALARYYVQVNGAAELVAHARSTLVLNRLFNDNGRTKCSPRHQQLQISSNCC